MEQLSARSSSHPRILRFESERVLELEKETKDLLDENERFRIVVLTECYVCDLYSK